MIIYIRDVQNLDFGQAFSNEDNCILFYDNVFINAKTKFQAHM